MERGGQIFTEKWSSRNDFMMDRLQQKLKPWEMSSTSSAAMEPRTCFILDRFTVFSSILFATDACETLLETTKRDLHDRSFYEFVVDRKEVKERLDAIRETNNVVHIPFTWLVPSTKKKIPCEAVATLAWDGLVLIVRRRIS